MKTKQQEKILYQEADKFNKPTVVVEVVRSNELSLRELKIYNILLRKLIDQSLADYQSYTVKTSISELSRELGVKNRSDIDVALEKLKWTGIKFDHIPDNGKAMTWSTNLIAGWGVEHKNKDSLKVEFSKYLAHEVLKYSERYVKLDLVEMNALKSSHAFTLYERIKTKLYKYNYQKQNYTEAELRSFLNLEDKYPEIKDFNKAVIKKALADISNHTELTVTLLKQSKTDEGRVYHLEVRRSGYNITLSSFKKVLRYLADTNQLNMTVKDGKKKRYSLEEQQVTDHQSRDELSIMWLNTETGKTVPTDKADELWEAVFLAYRADPVSFVEDNLNLDPSDFFDIEAGFIK